MSRKKIYEQLRKTLTDEEIAESYMIPEELNTEEEKAVLEEFRKLRFEKLRQQSEKDVIFSDLMRLRIIMKEYLENEPYSDQQNFGHFLEEYVRIVRKTKKEFAEDISVHYTRLSRLIHDREEPNIELAYRLEKHSGQVIPALLWWKLSIKKQEFLIKQDHQTRKEEGDKVKNPLKFRA